MTTTICMADIPAIISQACRTADLAGRDSPTWSRLSSLIDQALTAETAGDDHALISVLSSISTTVKEARK
ncbi:MAG: hypothetical protein GX442_23645 [Candidatus Riflebacteria bacterium]|nr:hypothetical protein [Candidatus Riflebacteria bacterium]